MAQFDIVSWQLRGETVKEPQKYEDGQHLAEIQSRNFAGRILNHLHHITLL